MRDKVCTLLYRLGLTENYTGFFYIMDAVCLAVEEPERLCFVTKLIYPDVAKKHRTTTAAVERGICLGVSRIWRADPEVLPRMFPVPLRERPTNARFLALLTAYVREEIFSFYERPGML